MTRPVINPGIVDWSGENPGMYLRETADGPFVTLISYFRVVLSPKGRGHAAFILQDPHGDGKNPAKPNLCITDNEPMAEYVRDGFVANFGAFKGIKGLSSIRMVPGWDFLRAGDGATRHTRVVPQHPGPGEPDLERSGRRVHGGNAQGEVGHRAARDVLSVRGLPRRRGLHQREGRGRQTVPARVRRQEGQQHSVPRVLGDLGARLGASSSELRRREGAEKSRRGT